jgi:putative Holliday junction resolvase
MAKVLGLDLGSRTCGVAISDISGILARVYETIRFNDDDYETCANKVVEICLKEKVTDIVLGMPKHMNGDIGVRGQISLDFKANLLSKGNFNVILWDERLSTVSANRVMLEGNMRREYRKEHKDELAAVVILQGYLDFKR